MKTPPVSGLAEGFFATEKPEGKGMAARSQGASPFERVLAESSGSGNQRSRREGDGTPAPTQVPAGTAPGGHASEDDAGTAAAPARAPGPRPVLAEARRGGKDRSESDAHPASTFVAEASVAPGPTVAVPRAQADHGGAPAPSGPRSADGAPAPVPAAPGKAGLPAAGAPGPAMSVAAAAVTARVAAGPTIGSAEAQPRPATGAAVTVDPMPSAPPEGNKVGAGAVPAGQRGAVRASQSAGPAQPPVAVAAAPAAKGDAEIAAAPVLPAVGAAAPPAASGTTETFLGGQGPRARDAAAAPVAVAGAPTVARSVTRPGSEAVTSTVPPSKPGPAPAADAPTTSARPAAAGLPDSSAAVNSLAASSDRGGATAAGAAPIGTDTIAGAPARVRADSAAADRAAAVAPRAGTSAVGRSATGTTSSHPTPVAPAPELTVAVRGSAAGEPGEENLARFERAAPGNAGAVPASSAAPSPPASATTSSSGTSAAVAPGAAGRATVAKYTSTIEAANGRPVAAERPTVVAPLLGGAASTTAAAGIQVVQRVAAPEGKATAPSAPISAALPVAAAPVPPTGDQKVSTASLAGKPAAEAGTSRVAAASPAAIAPTAGPSGAPALGTGRPGPGPAPRAAAPTMATAPTTSSSSSSDSTDRSPLHAPPVADANAAPVESAHAPEAAPVGKSGGAAGAAAVAKFASAGGAPPVRPAAATTFAGAAVPVAAPTSLRPPAVAPGSAFAAPPVISDQSPGVATGLASEAGHDHAFGAEAAPSFSGPRVPLAPAATTGRAASVPAPVIRSADAGVSPNLGKAAAPAPAKSVAPAAAAVSTPLAPAAAPAAPVVSGQAKIVASPPAAPIARAAISKAGEGPSLPGALPGALSGSKAGGQPDLLATEAPSPSQQRPSASVLAAAVAPGAGADKTGNPAVADLGTAARPILSPSGTATPIAIDRAGTPAQPLVRPRGPGLNLRDTGAEPAGNDHPASKPASPTATPGLAAAAAAQSQTGQGGAGNGSNPSAQEQMRLEHETEARALRTGLHGPTTVIKPARAPGDELATDGPAPLDERPGPGAVKPGARVHGAGAADPFALVTPVPPASETQLHQPRGAGPRAGTAGALGEASARPNGPQSEATSESASKKRHESDQGTLPAPGLPTFDLPAPAAANNFASVSDVSPAAPPLPPAAAAIMNEVNDDPALSVAVLSHAAHLSIAGDNGRNLELHVRLLPEGADIRAAGDLAPMMQARASELGLALAAQGVTLGRFELGDGDRRGGRDEADPADEAGDRIVTPRRSGRKSSDGESSPRISDGRIHVKA